MSCDISHTQGTGFALTGFLKVKMKISEFLANPIFNQIHKQGKKREERGGEGCSYMATL